MIKKTKSVWCSNCLIFFDSLDWVEKHYHNTAKCVIEDKHV